jgi:hypothetical protein
VWQSMQGSMHLLLVGNGLEEAVAWCTSTTAWRRLSLGGALAFTRGTVNQL